MNVFIERRTANGLVPVNEQAMTS